MDVRSLIADWEQIRGTVPPAELSGQLGPGAQMLDEIRDASRQRETWEVFVCLMAFSARKAVNPTAVLEEVEEGFRWGAFSGLRLAEEFVNYSSEFWTVGREAFLSGAIRLRRLLVVEHMILTRSSTLDVLQECRARHGSDWEQVWKCVKETGGGASVAAGA